MVPGLEGCKSVRRKREGLRQARKSAGLTQEELAYRLRVDRTTVGRWEAGETEPSAWLQPGLAKLLGVSRSRLSCLLDQHEPERPSVTSEDQLNDDERQHMVAALQDARRFVDHDVVSYFRRLLDACAQADGLNGAVPTLPRVLGILGAIETCAGEVEWPVLTELLSVAARGAEFAGWLNRDAHDARHARVWYGRATEFAQEANDTAMQGYVLLKKSQMAYDERDARHVLSLAQAAQYGPWTLSNSVRAEVTQQEARGLAMVGEPLFVVERKLDKARCLVGEADGADVHTQLGSPYTQDTLILRDASCYIEAGKPHHAASLYQQVLAGDVLSRRDRGYFLARLTFSLALSGEPDEAARTGLKAAQLAIATQSQRTRRELMRSVVTLRPWENRPGPRALREVVQAQPVN
jgi:transcriptional regulator with XRE-family HTH domain